MFGRFRQLNAGNPGAVGTWAPGGLALALGVTAGAVAYLAWRRRSRPRQVELLPSELAAIEEDAVAALGNDAAVGHRAIEVAAVGTGIIELTGDVENIEEAHHAVDVAQNVEDVHTVINRLTLVEPERHLAETRDRFHAGDAALHETQWQGMGVGMGRRRQSEATDPGRTDDHVKAVSRALEPDAAEAYAEPPAGEPPAGEPPAGEPAAGPEVEGAEMEPGSVHPEEPYGDERERAH